MSIKEWMIRVINALKVDYIVEEGTSGIWTYRKWNSGIAECWGYYDCGTVSTSSTEGSLKYSPLYTITFPTSLYLHLDSVNVNAELGDYICGAIIAVSGINNVQSRIWSAISITHKAYLHISAKGKWK